MTATLTTSISEHRDAIARIVADQKQKLSDALREADARLADAIHRRTGLEAAVRSNGLTERERELHRRACDLMQTFDNREEYRPRPCRRAENGIALTTEQEDRQVAAEKQKIKQRDDKMRADVVSALSAYEDAVLARFAAEREIQTHPIHAQLLDLQRQRDEASAAYHSFTPV